MCVCVRGGGGGTGGRAGRQAGSQLGINYYFLVHNSAIIKSILMVLGGILKRVSVKYLIQE